MKIIKRYQDSEFFIIKNIIGGGIGFLLALTANFAYALTAPSNILTSTGSIITLFCNALNWFFWIVIILSIAMALVAAYTYMTAQGDSEKVGKATKTLTYVAIGIVVALMAKAVPLLVGSFIGAPSGSVGNACSGNNTQSVSV